MQTKIKFAVVLALGLFALSFFIPKSLMQATEVETAGRRFKNIKVLNEMPADEMGKVMNLMSAGLGVNCGFCHTGDDFARDGKKEKETAREMLRMTLDLNKNNFGGRAEISCNTCHRGSEHPQSAINLNPLPPRPLSEERAKQPDAAKPTIDRILEKYTEAIGGGENLAKITSRKITASRVEPDGKIEPEEMWQDGGKILITTKYPEITVTEAFDGAKVWKRAGSFDIPLKPDEIEQTRRNAQFLSLTDLKTIYPKMDFRSVETINGREVYSVAAVTAENHQEHLYFDAQTGFLVRRTAATPTVLGTFQHQVDYDDYKDFGGGVKLPSTIRYAVPNINWTRKILEVRNNVSVDAAKFKPN